MTPFPSHAAQQTALKRIEGQIRGIQGMIASGTYCVDILHQIHAAIAALAGVEDRILARHFEHCVAQAVGGKSAAERQKKLDEILDLISRFRKT